jgi:hypothetical protein
MSILQKYGDQHRKIIHFNVEEQKEPHLPCGKKPATPAFSYFGRNPV